MILEVSLRGQIALTIFPSLFDSTATFSLEDILVVMIILNHVNVSAYPVSVVVQCAKLA